jgi:archaeal flagellar protein FlaJ
MLEDLKKNVSQEKKIILDIKSNLKRMSKDKENKKKYLDKIQALMRQIQILNNAAPDLLKKSSTLKKVIHQEQISKSKDKAKKIIPMSYVPIATKSKNFISVDKKDKAEFLKSLKLSSSTFKELRDHKKSKLDQVAKSNKFAGFSNRFFRNYSEKISKNFQNLDLDLKKANMEILLKTYLSMALLSSTISFFVGLVIFGTLIFFNLKNFIFFWIPIVLPGVVFMAFYLYPSGEVSSTQKKISQEIPFATIHMTAIAGSNIEPSKIFKIVADSNEYPTIGREIRKIIIQIEVYGYDLVTSLKNVARRTANKRLAELFAGFATNISTGGSLKNYLEQKSQSFLLDYRLEREKYTQLAGTFMDIYISILIAAPLVLMMMFIVMNVSGLGVGGLSIQILLFLSIAGIALMNILFLVVLNIKQPKA